MSKVQKISKDITGNKYNYLTAVKFIPSEKRGSHWLFRCDCGKEVILRISLATLGINKSCGCLSESNRFKSKTVVESGTVINKITFVSNIGKKGHDNLWVCNCHCGNTFECKQSNILTGHTKSCGCLRKKLTSERRLKHGMCRTSTYNIYMCMMNRCYNPKDEFYSDYGGRGIKVADRWHEFESFFADMGVRPNGKSIDRIDNNGDYGPNNCRWATKKQQANNTRSNVYIEHEGVVKTMMEWSEEKGIPYHKLRYKIKKGVPASIALS